MALGACIGTPSGVGPVKPGDTMTGGLTEKQVDGTETLVSTISFDVVARKAKL